MTLRTREGAGPVPTLARDSLSIDSVRQADHVEVELESVERLRFADGSPVRAASAVAPFGNGYLVVQDDATHGAWFDHGSATAVRLLPPVAGLDAFEEVTGTKHLKPDLEAACQVTIGSDPALLLLGSGSSPARMRAVLLKLEGSEPSVTVAALAPLYAAVSATLAVEPEHLNIEGACLVGPALRCYHRGLPSAGLPSGSVDLELSQVLAATSGRVHPGSITVTNPRHYELGAAHGVGLAVTDVVALPDGSILASAAAEDSPNPRDDGPVVASALVRLDSDIVSAVAPLPLVEGRMSKVEGLMVLEAQGTATRLLAVVDVDDPRTPSLALRLLVRH